MTDPHVYYEIPPEKRVNELSCKQIGFYLSGGAILLIGAVAGLAVGLSFTKNVNSFKEANDFLNKFPLFDG